MNCKVMKKHNMLIGRLAVGPLVVLLIVSMAAADTLKTPTTIRLEAEAGKTVGTIVMKNGKGFSGTGYVGGFDQPGDAVQFSIPVTRAGIYDVRITYRAPNEKGFDLVVNGKKMSGLFPPSKIGFATYNAGKIELNTGTNELVIEKGWGYYEIDALELIPIRSLPTPRKLKPNLVDAKATPKTRRLMRFLTDHYGSKTLSGQQNIGDVKFIQETTTLSPAILSMDLIEYSPSRVAHGSHPEGTTEQLIREYHSGHILSVMWHWNAPKDLLDKKYTDKDGKQVDADWYFGFYTRATTFDLSKALANPNSEDYKLLIRDIDVIAAELKKLQAADVPVLWRPLHEAEGGWFWWGAKGPEAFKKLWRLMYDRLTIHHQLHNLIWVYTSGGKKDWYPGDAMVDIVGTDAYPSDVTDPLSNIWGELLTQFNGRKMLALTEFGGVPDVARMAKFGVRWSYFASWGDDLGPKKVSRKELARLYREPGILNKKDVIGILGRTVTKMPRK